MYDLIVIGAGPGGSIAAERAGAMGKSVLIIEKGYPGGVCLNSGCIPTKALLNSSKIYFKSKNTVQFGVHADNAEFNLQEAMAWKLKTIEILRKGVAYQMKRFGVEFIEGEAVIKSDNSIIVNQEIKKARNILIATGSSPVRLSIPGIDSGNVLTSKEALEITELPGKVVIIGGGVIGMEFASFFSNLGIDVDLIEILGEVLPFMEPEFSKLMRRGMKRVKFHTGCRVEKIEEHRVTFSREGKTEFLNSDLILMAAGRTPNVEGLGLEDGGVDFSSKGINVNNKLQTNISGIYAAGDVTGRSFLAHSASRMGEVAVNVMFGKGDRMDFDSIPWAVYTLPEAAGCGLTEEEAVKKGLDIKTGLMQMRANGRFLAENGVSSPGMCKVVVDSASGRLIGIHLLGSYSSEIIAAASTIIKNRMTVDKVKQTVFPHPSVSEVIRDVLFEL